MITNIQLHPSQQARLNEVDLERLEKDVLSHFPYPIAVSYRNFLKATSGGDGMNILTTFAYDVTTSIFQFLALVLASDYHESRSARSLKIYNAIADMSYRPGPGKWLEFLKMYPNHLKESNEKSFAFGEIISFIEINVGGKKKPRLTIEENYGNAPGKQAGLLEFMVMFRNNLAHSKGQKDKDITDQAASVVAVTNYLFSELSFLMQYRLVIKTEDITNPFYMMGDSLAALPELDIDENIFLQKESHGLKLFPLIISDRPAKSRPEDVFMLESVDNDRVFFSGNRIMSEKLKGRDDMANKVFDFLQNIYTEPEILDLARTSWEQLRNRCKDYSQQVLSDYVINNKYNEAVYVLPESYQETISGFRKSGKQVVFLTDGQGSGKSAFCAHLTNEFISHGNTNEASLLIDARLLEELQEEQDIFLEFIKKKLGLQGELPDFFRKLQDLEDNPKITLIIDNMNEYFLKERDQSFLLEQLFDTVNRFAGLNNIQIIVIARPEYYVKSFGKYGQSFQDFVAKTTYMPSKTAATPLPGLEENETEKIWNNYQKKFTGYSPRTGWSDLNISVRKSCNNPLIMLFLLKRYDNEELPENLSLEKIKKQYIRGILKKKELKKTLFDLVKKMHKEQRPYLLTDSFSREEIARLFDTTKDEKTNLPRNHAYASLVDMQILREERVENEGKSGKKISVNNEMTQDVIVQEYKKIGVWNYLKQGVFMQLLILLTACLLIPMVAMFLIFDADIAYDLRYEFTKQEILLDESVEMTQIHFLIQDYIDANYPNKLVLKKLGFISASIVFLFVIVFFFHSIIPMIIHMSSRNKFESRFSFFDSLEFKIQNQNLYKKFIKIARISVLFFVVAIIWISIKTPTYKNIDSKLISYLVFFVIFLCALLIYFYTEAILNKKINEKYILADFHHNALLRLFLSSLSVLIILLFFLANFNSIFTYQFEKAEDYFKQKSTNHLLEITSSDTSENIQTYLELIIANNCENDESDSRVCNNVKYLRNALAVNEHIIPLDRSSLSWMLEDFLNAGEDLFERVWLIALIIFISLQLLITAIVYIPVLTAKVLMKNPDKIKVI
jgi:hypothetical protein